MEKTIGFEKIAFIGLGGGATCSIVAFVWGGMILSWYTIFLITTFCILLTGEKKPISVFGTKASRFYGLWTLSALLSSVFGLLFFMGQDEWMTAAVSFVPKVVLYFLFFFLLFRSAKSFEYVNYILKGLLWGVILNTAWASADAIIFYLSGYSITNEIFRSYILATNTRYEMLSLIIGGVIRSGGLNGDPANIGMFAPILASYSLYSKKYWFYVLSLISTFSSVSIVALASIFIITLIYMFSHKKAIGIGVIFVIILIGGTSYVVIGDDGVTGQMVAAVTDRLEEKSESDMNDRDNVRAMYWFKFLPAVATTPSALLVGTGYGTASYAYIHGDYVRRSEPYDPEQTYFSTYFDVGLCGFVAFVLLLVYLIRIAYKNQKEEHYLFLFTGMEGMMIAFMGYHYTVYSVSMLYIIVGTVLTSNRYVIKQKI